MKKTHFNIFNNKIGSYGSHFESYHESGTTVRIATKKYLNNIYLKKLKSQQLTGKIVENVYYLTKIQL